MAKDDERIPRCKFILLVEGGMIFHERIQAGEALHLRFTSVISPHDVQRCRRAPEAAEQIFRKPLQKEVGIGGVPELVKPVYRSRLAAIFALR